MEPVGGEALHAGGAFGLGDLVLVVREAEVDAAAVPLGSDEPGAVAEAKADPTTTEAPARASSAAIARPMPRDAPVTSATFPSISG